MRWTPIVKQSDADLSGSGSDVDENDIGGSDGSTDEEEEEESRTDEVERFVDFEEELEQDASTMDILKPSHSSLSETHNLSRITSKPRENPVELISEKTMLSTFASLGVSKPLQAALSSMSIRTPTEVQVACIPPLLTGEFKLKLMRLATNSCFQRQRLHRKCQNWVRKDSCICDPHPTKTVRRSIRYIRAYSHTDKVRFCLIPAALTPIQPKNRVVESWPFKSPSNSPYWARR